MSYTAADLRALLADMPGVQSLSGGQNGIYSMNGRFYGLAPGMTSMEAAAHIRHAEALRR